MPLWAALIPAAVWMYDKLSGGNASGSSAISSGMDAMGNSMNTAMGSIDAATKKAMGFNEPYMNPEVFRKMSDLVTSGAFQQPFQKSFQAQPWQTPGMQFNPSKGSFGMTPWQASGAPPTMTPQGLPPGMAQMIPRPQAPTPQAPVAQGPQQNPLDQNAVLQKIQEMLRAATPQQLPPGATNLGPPGNPVAGRNPQTGQGGPVDPLSGKPVDPRMPSMQDFFRILMNSYAKGQSGPLEGGMPRSGIPGRVG